jgi:hypothetical protein
MTDYKVRAELAEAVVIGLREALSGCGNRPCILHTGPYSGVYTNGSCRCRDHIERALEAIPQQLADRVYAAALTRAASMAPSAAVAQSLRSMANDTLVGIGEHD